MRLSKLFLLALLTAPQAFGQIPAPQINLSGNIGCQGFPCLNNGTLVMATDANHTMTAVETSAFYVRVTSSVPLTAPRNLIYPAGRFPAGIENATTGGQVLNVCAPSGACVPITNSSTTYTPVWNDGTNFVQGGGGGNAGIFLSQAPAGSGSFFTLSFAPLTVTGIFYNGAWLNPGIDYQLTGASLQLNFLTGTGDSLWATYYHN